MLYANIKISTLLLYNPVIVRPLGRSDYAGAEHPLSVRVVKFPATKNYLGRQVIGEGVCLLLPWSDRLGDTHGHVTILCNGVSKKFIDILPVKCFDSKMV